MKQSRHQSAQKPLRKNETRQTPVQSVVHLSADAIKRLPSLPSNRQCIRCGHRLFRPNLESNIWQCAGPSCEARYREPQQQPADEGKRTHYLLYCATFITSEERRVLDHQGNNPTLRIAQASLREIQSRDHARLVALLKMKRRWEYPEQAFLQSLIEAKSAIFRVYALSLAFQEAGAEVWIAPFDDLANIRRAHTKWMTSERAIKRWDLRKTMVVKSRVGRLIGQAAPPEKKQDKVITPNELELIHERLSGAQLSLQSTTQYHKFLLDAYGQLRKRGVPRKRAIPLLAGLVFVHVPGYQAVQAAKRRHGAPSPMILDTLVHRLNMMINRARLKSTPSNLL
jgi:hypothetical protein